MGSISAMMDFPPSWILSKTFKTLLLSQILSDRHQISHTSSTDHASLTHYFFSSELWAFARTSQSKSAATAPFYVWAHISATLRCNETKFGSTLPDSVPSVRQKSGVAWPLGGAKIGKTLFLLISLDAFRFEMKLWYPHIPRVAPVTADANFSR